MPCSRSQASTNSEDSLDGATISLTSCWLKCLPYLSCFGFEISSRCCSIEPGFCCARPIFKLTVSRFDAGPTFDHDRGTMWRSLTACVERFCEGNALAILIMLRLVASCCRNRILLYILNLFLARIRTDGPTDQLRRGRSCSVFASRLAIMSSSLHGSPLRNMVQKNVKNNMMPKETRAAAYASIDSR